MEEKVKHYWGVASATHNKTGDIARFIAVRYTDGKSGYETEADFVHGRVVKTFSRSQATVHAVDCAIEFHEMITSKVREAYPTALREVFEEQLERAKKSVEKAKLALVSAVLDCKGCESIASGRLLSLPNSWEPMAYA